MDVKKKSRKKDLFNIDSRLNKYQRRYCSCLMKVRPTVKKNASYPICYSSIKRKYKSMKKKKSFDKVINLGNLNCLFNYDFNKYTLRDLQYLAKEKGIPLKQKKIKNLFILLKNN